MSSHSRAWAYLDLNQAVDGPLLAPSWSATTWLLEETREEAAFAGRFSLEGGEVRLAGLVAAVARSRSLHCDGTDHFPMRGEPEGRRGEEPGGVIFTSVSLNRMYEKGKSGERQRD